MSIKLSKSQMSFTLLVGGPSPALVGSELGSRGPSILSNDDCFFAFCFARLVDTFRRPTPEVESEPIEESDEPLDSSESSESLSELDPEASESEESESVDLDFCG